MARGSESIRRAVERSTGRSIDELRREPLDVQRRAAQKKWGALFKVVSWFPIVGRGNVMRDRVITHDEVEALLDEALKG